MVGAGEPMAESGVVSGGSWVPMTSAKAVWLDTSVEVRDRAAKKTTSTPTTTIAAMMSAIGDGGADQVRWFAVEAIVQLYVQDRKSATLGGADGTLGSSGGSSGRTIPSL